MKQDKKKVGNYLLINKIGQGQFGVVYKGVLIENQSKVFAIKCIQKSKLEGNSVLNKLFQTEMSVMSKLNHPNIMHLYEFMETAHNYYLVIQYCNNGDLENHLKSMGRLSEEESVYFLMQIMNGFQVLHKNKIMHRDVKLANLFLQDDRVVIGDFGFAKQGVDVTKTKLGTPITMAPELLSSTGNSYTSKADLWSIGVCFYQMLFGRTPFDAKTYDDLKDKVRTQSGAKLRFPKDVPISEECRSLLVALMQYDANARIEWKDFFNHPLFEKHAQKRNGGITQITQSMIDRQNENTVKSEFVQNKKNAVNEVVLENPENLQGNVQTHRANEGELDGEAERFFNEAEQLEENFRVVRARYCHEKKKVIFVMYTVRKIRNLAKLRAVFGDAADSFMYAACVLLKKGLLMNAFAIQSLQSGSNVFALRDFDRFLATEDNAKIQKNFEEDEKIYQTFYADMNAKLRNEVSSLEFKSNVQTFNACKYADIPALDAAMAKLLRSYRDRMPGFKMDAAQEAEFATAMVHFHYSITSDAAFPFIKDNKIFEWKTFENDNQPEAALATFKKLNL